MELFARRGRPATAIKQYRACVRLLDVELGMEPEEETSALYRAIKEKRLDPPDSVEQVEQDRGDIAWEDRIDHTPEAINPLGERS